MKTDCRVISCLKIRVRKLELKSIYEANLTCGDSYLCNRMNLKIPPKVWQTKLLYKVEDLGRLLLPSSHTYVGSQSVSHRSHVGSTTHL